MEKNSLRVLRGGSWYGNPRFCRSAYRGRRYPVNRNYFYGFRVLCVPRAPKVKEGEKSDGK